VALSVASFRLLVWVFEQSYIPPQCVYSIVAYLRPTVRLCFFIGLLHITWQS